MGSQECREKMAAAKRGKRAAETNNWKGGHQIGGYCGVGGGSKKTYKHRVIAEEVLGRKLLSSEHVHHMDKNRQNNELENLLVLSATDHSRLHAAMRKNKELDQRTWLKEMEINFEDLQEHAENSK